MTQAEAEAIIKAAIASPVPGSGSGSCSYSPSGVTEAHATILKFTDAPDKGVFDKSRGHGTDPQEISGLGDAAFCEIAPFEGYTIADLFVYIKAKQIEISVASSSCDDGKLFAQKAIGRL